MKLSVKIRQFYWCRKNNTSFFKEIKQNLPHVYRLVCSVCLKQIFCNANGATTPDRLQHFSHLVQWFMTLIYGNGGANTDIQSGCTTAVVMHKEILVVWQQCTWFTQRVWYLLSFYYFFLHNLHSCKMCDGISSLPLHNIIKLVKQFFTYCHSSCK